MNAEQSLPPLPWEQFQKQRDDVIARLGALESYIARQQQHITLLRDCVRLSAQLMDATEGFECRRLSFELTSSMATVLKYETSQSMGYE